MTEARERVGELVILHGEEVSAVGSAPAGTICAARGLKSVSTGDTLLLRPKPGCTQMRLPGVTVLPPVFFCAIEVDEAAAEEALDNALAAICLEDPSVAVSFDRATGETFFPEPDKVRQGRPGSNHSDWYNRRG